MPIHWKTCVKWNAKVGADNWLAKLGGINHSRLSAPGDQGLGFNDLHEGTIRSEPRHFGQELLGKPSG